MKTSQTFMAAYNIIKWMQHLEDDVSKVEVRNDEVSNHGTGWKNAHSQHLGRSTGLHRRHGAPQLLRETCSESPSSGGGSSDQRSKWSSH